MDNRANSGGQGCFAARSANVGSGAKGQGHDKDSQLERHIDADSRDFAWNRETGRDIAAASHHFSVIAVYFKRISRLGADADKIVGGKDIVFGKTETTLTVDSYITDEDPSEYSFDFDIVMEQPPHASGFY
jgi:hypothetical protein